jgi:AraC-like DNA-binding protein
VQSAGSEIEELSAFFHGWNVEFIRLGPRSEQSLLSCASFPSHRILRLHAGGALVVRGSVPKACACVLLSASPQAAVRYLGEPLRAQDLMLAGADASIDLYVPGGALLCTLVLGPQDYISRRELRIYRGAGNGAEVVTTLTQYLRTADQQGSEQNETLAGHIRHAAAAAKSVRPDQLARTGGICAVVAACRAVEKRFPAPISSRELARVCGVSERTLEYGFRHVYDTTPMAFIRSQRLTRSRTALLRAAAATSISATARAYGFTHMGQYSRDYRRLFGETPSRTLMRGQL